MAQTLQMIQLMSDVKLKSVFYFALILPLM